MIIDIHSHLGDILYPNGGDLIFKTGAVKQRMYDPQNDNEKMLMRNFGLGKIFYTLLMTPATKAQRARNATATLENLRASLDEANISYTACMPVAPHVTFDDLKKAADMEPRIIPFTSVDFTKAHDVDKKLEQDVSRGAAGLKLHPIIQNMPLTDQRTMEALQSFSRHNKPVLVHSGKSHYYLKSESHLNSPENGDIADLEHVVRSFPDIKFIVGHAGLFWQDQVRKRLHDCKNVWLDTSFQSPEVIRKLMSTFGPEKVMYASDWPWGSRLPHIKTVKVACRGDSSLEKMLFYSNAAELLGMNV